MKTFALLLSLASAPAMAGSVYDHINSSDFKNGVKASYLASVASNVQRTKLIATAEEECGGRYEGTEIEVTELKHEIDASDKQVIHTPDPNNYSVKYKASAKNVWQVSETIKCSIHGGHYRSVLHAKVMSGIETAEILYTYVNDTQAGDESVTYLSRKYTPHSSVLQYSYQTPYGTKVAP